MVQSYTCCTRDSSLHPGTSAGRPKVYLTYHEIAPGDDPYRYRVSIDEFECHLRLAAQAVGAARKLAVPAFTFDDGHETSFTHVLPMLDRFGVSGTFFITTGWTGERPGYMDWSQICELARRGHSIGSHSETHRFLTGCSDADLQAEITNSKARLEEHLGLEVTSISMPGGRWDRRVVAACGKAGYRTVFTSDPWTAKQIGEVAVLGRMNVSKGTGPERLVIILSPSSVWARAYRARLAAQRGARRLLGDRRYHALWCWWSGSPDTADWEAVE